MSRTIFPSTLLAALIAFSNVTSVAEDTAGLKPNPGRRPLKLWPPEEGETLKKVSSLSLEGWRYEAVKAATALDGVPWQLIVRPIGRNAEIWMSGPLPRNAGIPQAIRIAAEATDNTPAEIPVIEVPEVLWRKRMEADLQGVVGIHFHELVSDDLARLLFTLHKIPPDPPEGAAAQQPPHPGRSGTRLEATLLAPVVWSLDQCIAVRVDNMSEPEPNKRERLTRSRIEHEVGHAGVSIDVMLGVVRGPQDWSPQYATGRRSQVEYYWRRETIGRSWDGYQRSAGDLKTLRTSIALVPPTRWSKLVPIPPERVTQEHLDQFNKEIVDLGPVFFEVDRVAQERFHAHHGAYESAGSP